MCVFFFLFFSASETTSPNMRYENGKNQAARQHLMRHAFLLFRFLQGRPVSMKMLSKEVSEICNIPHVFITWQRFPL